MTSTPDKDAPDQWGSPQQTAHPGETVPQQSATPGQEQRADQGQQQPGPEQDGVPGQSQAGSPQPGTIPAQQGGYQGAKQQGGYGAYPGEPQPWTGQPGVMMATGIPPVTYAETRVVGRRVVQYIVDSFLASIIPGLALWLFDRGSAIGWLVATIIALAAYFYYWVLWPYSHHGQTIGMRLFHLRIISKDGNRASMMQLLVRGVLLIVDTLVFGLVGLITMACSKYHQRVGDHLAHTVVVKARHHVME
jgi:uncharacterized RDD family membrane protein YckC